MSLTRPVLTPPRPYTHTCTAWWLAAINQLFLLVPAISLVAFWRPRAGIALCLLACLGSYMYSFVTGQREEWRLNAFMRPGFPNFFNHCAYPRKRWRGHYMGLLHT